MGGAAVAVVAALPLLPILALAGLPVYDGCTGLLVPTPSCWPPLTRAHPLSLAPVRRSYSPVLVPSFVCTPLAPWCCCWSPSSLSLASHFVSHPLPLAPLALCVRRTCLALVWLLPAWLCVHADPHYPVTLGWPSVGLRSCSFALVCTRSFVCFLRLAFICACSGSLGL